MAKSGSTKVNVTSDGYIYLLFSWSAGTQNITSNYTPVTWKLQLVSTNSSANISSTAAKDCSVVVNGKTVFSGTTTVGLSGGATKTLKSGTVNVSHNSDGTKTFGYSFSQEFAITYSGSSIGTKSGSGSGTLDTIPRGSKLGTLYNFTIGADMTIPITKYASSYSDTLRIYLGSTLIKTVAGITDGQVVNFTTAELNTIYNAMPNVSSATFKFAITTYSGSTTIGANEKTVTGTLTASIKPVVSSVTIAEAVAGIDGQFGGYVQGKSKLKVTINATAGTGSSISSYKAVINGHTYTAGTFTTNVLSASGSIPINITVTDRRGRTNTYSTSVNVLAYEMPKVTTFNVVRCKSNGTEDVYGEYVKINAAASISSVNSKNAKAFKIDYRVKGATAWTNLLTYTTNYAYTLANSIHSGFSGDNPYEFRIVATDFFVNVVKTDIIGSAFAILDFKADGKGLAVGKVSSKQAFEVGMDIYDKFDTQIRNGLALYETGGATDVNTTLEELVLSATNTPDTGFWYVKTMFYNTKSATSNRTQTAYPYNQKKAIYSRYYVSGTGWSEWFASDISSFECEDTSGSIHFGNGYLVQWGRVTITPSAANAVTSITINFPIAYDKVPKVSAVAHASTPNAITTSVGGGTTTDASKKNMVVYMTRTNTSATIFQWEAKGQKAVIE